MWPWREAPAIAAARAAAEARVATRMGLVQGSVAVLVGMALRWVFHRPVMAGTVVVVGTVIALLAIASPRGAYAALQRAVARFGVWLGAAMRWLLMPLVFYGLFLPFGVARRFSGKTQRMLPRRPDPALDTYWKPSPPQTEGVEPYRRQF